MKKMVHLLFTHQEDLFPTLAMLGIGQSEQNFNYSDVLTENKNRTFRSSQLTPMNANIAFVLYNCDSSASTNLPPYMLRVFHNEKLVKVNGCNSVDCDLNNFLKYYSFFKRICLSSKISCAL